MLRDLQQGFLEGVFDESGTPPIISAIQTGRTLDPREQFEVYRDSIIACLTRSLEIIYPVCLKLVGEEFFHAMSAAYINEHHSHAPDLHSYGSEFAGFLDGFRPVQSMPYLPDTARLEWAWHRAFHGSNTAVLDVAALAGVDTDRQEDIVLCLPVCGTLLESHYPIHRIWEVNQDGYTRDDIVDLAEGGVKLLVWRQGLDMRIDPLTAEERDFLCHVRDGEPLGGVFEAVLEKSPDTDVAALLQNILRRGFVCSFTQSQVHGSYPRS